MKKLSSSFLAVTISSYLLLFVTVRAANADSNEIVCTPVYGMANTCAEHAVVDTALDTSIFYNLASMSYVLGLAAFIKSKRI